MTPLNEKSNETGASGSGQDSSRVRWDQAETHTIRPTTFNIAINPGHIGLIFGRPEKAGANGDVPVIKLDVQILLSPVVAKRLSVLLKGLIGRYESRFGSVSSDGLKGRGQKPQYAGVSRSAGPSDSLIHLVQSLGPECAFEKSFKICRGNILDNRFLMGLSVKAIGSNANARLMEVCNLLGMPEPMMRVFAKHLARASYVYFAFEENGKKQTYKAYLEFLEAIKEGIQQREKPPDKALLHLGIKWDIKEPSKHILTRYTWHPYISGDEIVRRAAAAVPDDAAVGAGIVDVVKDLVALALAKIPDRDIQYLEVTEDGNPRRSFDINVYKANLQVEELYPILAQLAHKHGVSEFKFHSLFNAIGSQRFGHLAGGLDREGDPFFTVYYGVEWVPGDSGRFPDSS